MQRYFILFVFFSFFYMRLSAQEVITTAGDFQLAGTGSLSWTLGETITETYSNGFNFLTQGFNQSQLSATSIHEISGLSYKIEAFPNPTSDFLILQTDQLNDIEYQVFGLRGELIYQDKLYSPETKIDFRRLTPSTYFIKIYQNKGPVKQFKIVKQ